MDAHDERSHRGDPPQTAAPEGSSSDLRLHWGWYASVFALALALRLSALWLAGKNLVFLKYPKAAQLLAEGTLGQERVLDFSPLYLELHRLALWAGLTSIDWLRTLQCLVGACSCLLVLAIGRNLLGRTAGVIAGLLAALSRDLVQYDQVFEPETLLVLLVLACFWLLSRGGPTRLWTYPLAGALLGLAVATRPSAMVLLPVALALAAARHRSQRWRARLVPVAFLLLGLGPVQLGFAVRDRAHSPRTTAMSPWQVFYTGNNPMATGLWRSDFIMSELQQQTRGLAPDHGHQVFRELARAAGAAEEQPDRYWLGLSSAFIRTYPGRFLELVLHKTLALGQPHDPHDLNTVYRLQDRLQRWPLLSTSLLMSVGLAGLVVLRRRLWWLALALLAQAAVCVVFLVSARHRLHLLPWVCIGSAATLHHAWLWLASRSGSSFGFGSGSRAAPAVSRRTIAGLLFATATFTLVFRLPLEPGHFAGHDSALARRSQRSLRAAWKLQRDDRLRSAAQQLGLALGASPWRYLQQPISRVPFPLPAVARSQLPLARRQAQEEGTLPALLRLGYLLDLAGERRRAVEIFDELERRVRWPGDARIAFMAATRKGRALLALQRPGPALAAFRRAAEIRPGTVEALVGVAVASGDEAALAEAARVNPLFEVLYFHGRLLLDAGRPREAARPLARLTRALPEYARGRMLYAVALQASALDRAVEQAVRAQKSHPALFDPEYGPLEMIHQAALKEPGQEKRWRRLATFAELYGDKDLALAAWSRLQRLRPLDAPELVRVGWLHLRHQEPKAATGHLERALRLDPRVEHGKEGLAIALEREAEPRHRQ